MAIKHIKILARELAERYYQVERLCLEFAENTADVCLSPEDAKEFAMVRAVADAQLSLLSVALSAAVNPVKFAALKKEVAAPVKAFSAALTMILEDVNNPDAPAKTKDLLEVYCEQLKKARETQLILERIEFYKNLPNAKRKCRDRLKDFIARDCVIIGKLRLYQLEDFIGSIVPPFTMVDLAICDLRRYIIDASSVVVSSAGDFDE